MNKVKLIIPIIGLLFSLQLFAQNPISGIVKDASTGEPLLGATIMIKGTGNGTITDIDGNFSLQTNSKEDILSISFLGYIAQEMPIGDQTTFNIQLAPNTENLDELVVVGYTVKKKRDVLGAIGKIDNKEISKIPVSNAQQALQGRIAGVNVTSQTGAPGASISVRIRGAGTGNNDPLYIVDGIPVENGLDNISPNDIENMSILKDASASAIYGSRATNGVVLITTKSGKEGEAKINYNGQFGIQTHGKLTEMCNTEQYIELYNEAATNDNANSSVQREFISGSWVKDFADVNHLEEIFRTATLQTHELSISGGNEKTHYLMSGSIYNQEGIINNTDFKRLNLRSNVDSQVKKWLKVGLNANGGYSTNRMVSDSGDGYNNDQGGSVVRYALFRNPAIPVYNENGEYIDLPSEYYGDFMYDAFFEKGYSPEGLCDKTDRVKKAKSLMVAGNVLINLPKNIFIKTTAGTDYNNSLLRVYNATWGTNNRINSTNSLSLTSTTSNTWTVNSTINHSITINEDHSITSMIGAEAIQNTTSVLYATESDFTDTDPNLIYLGFGNRLTDNSQNETSYSLMSYFGNINYNYKHKYYLSGIIRRDGSSRFAEGNRWGTFYSLSGGWNMESEDFMKNAEKINKLKIRVGYGAIGNQNIPLYSYYNRMANGYYYTFGGKAYNGFVQSQLGNEDLKWETSQQFNAGVDIEMFEQTFGVSIDYYYKTIKDMLLESSIPLSVGNASAAYINCDGTVLNTGVDLEIFYRKRYKEGGFDITFNGGYLYNKVSDLDKPLPRGRVDTGVDATKTESGYPIGSFYLYEMDGIFQNESEIITSAYQGADIEPGDVKYVDKNKDGIINAQDRTHCGSAIPKITAGLNLGANYKGFDFSAFFQGAFGQKIFSQVNYDIEGFYRGFNVTKRYYDERWTGEGTSNTQPRASWSGKSNNVKASTRFLEDGSYIRLKNIQLGYSVPNTQKWHLEKVRVYVSATNLFTITKYNGLDPEMTVSANASSDGDLANGIDWGTYPVAKVFTLGLNLTF